MQNKILSGNTLTLTAPSGDVVSGGAYLIGSLLVIANGDAVEGDPFEAETAGVFELAKTTGQAWTEGQKLYWKVSTSKLTSTATDGQLVGVATAAAASGDTTGLCRLNGVAPAASEGPQAAIADLTDNSGGTANDTITAVGGLTTLTDSTGLSGTHDDTLAATAVPADLTGGESPTEAEHNALLAVTRVIAQNSSDIGQKVIEVVADVEDCKNNFADLTAKVNSILGSLRATGIIASS